jgi:hypothetical protein
MIKLHGMIVYLCHNTMVQYIIDGHVGRPQKLLTVRVGPQASRTRPCATREQISRKT